MIRFLQPLATGGIPSIVWIIIAVLVVIALLIFILRGRGTRSGL